VNKMKTSKQITKDMEFNIVEAFIFTRTNRVNYDMTLELDTTRKIDNLFDKNRESVIEVGGYNWVYNQAFLIEDEAILEKEHLNAMGRGHFRNFKIDNGFKNKPVLYTVWERI
tara:strand:+ start:149 stop:487 length:339 start_codon:yes stop_codon:yes gene_type:complete